MPNGSKSAWSICPAASRRERIDTMKRVAIFGTSGMAREAGDIAYASGLRPIYVAHHKEDLGPGLGPDDVIAEEECLKLHDVPFVIGIGDNAVRRRVASRYAGRLRFTNLIHPSATFGYRQRDAIEDRQGLVIAAGARLTNRVTLGDFTIVNQGVLIAHDVVVGEHVHLAPGCIISGNVHIGSGCLIGAGAVVNQGSSVEPLMIGPETVIGSGSAVIRSCDAGSVYVGSPARRIKCLS